MTLQKDPERQEVKYLNKHADLRGKRILEIGCGDGRLTWRYAAAARHVIGIDLDRDELRVASIERSSALEHTVRLAQADTIHLPFRERAFDLALLAWTF